MFSMSGHVPEIRFSSNHCKSQKSASSRSHLDFIGIRRCTMLKSELILLALLSVVGAMPTRNNSNGVGKSSTVLELECRFGNFCDQFVEKLQKSLKPPLRCCSSRSLSATLEWFYTCESFNMRVMIDDTKVLSIYGEHNETMTNDDVLVFSNVFTKTRYLPNGIAKKFANLERFYVASSRLKFISRKNFIGFNKLKNLDLRFNEIETIPDDAFIDLFNLEVLTISGNLIKKLPMNAFVSTMELRYFDASDNEVKEFDDEIFSQSSKLEEILLENNRIKHIKSKFQKFNNVGFIDLRNNLCTDMVFLRDHPGYPLIFEFQQKLNQNCSKVEATIALPPGTKIERKVLEWDMCPRLMLPMNMLCLIERKFMNEVKKIN